MGLVLSEDPQGSINTEPAQVWRIMPNLCGMSHKDLKDWLRPRFPVSDTELSVMASYLTLAYFQGINHGTPHD